MAKNTSKKAVEKPQIEKKQIIVAVIIFIVAVLMIVFSLNTFKAEKTVSEQDVKEIIPQKEKVVVNFTTETQAVVNYTIYYTTKADENFSDENSIQQEGKEGLNTYEVTLPVSEISRFRLSFSKDAGNIKIISITLSGGQKEDLSNFTAYEMFMMENISLNEDGSLSFSSTYPQAGLTYIPILGTVFLDEENPVMIEEIKPEEETINSEENLANTSEENTEEVSETAETQEEVL